MRENKIRTIWQNGGAAVNGWLAIPNSFATEVMAHQGWDSLTIDMQHGMVDYHAAVGMLQAVSTTETVPLVRVPYLEPGIIMKSLDAGAYGIICPLINTRADAEALVSYARYAPQGGRSFGPTRALIYGGPDYPQKANETIFVMAMLETQQAMDNLESILTVPGLDAVYIGPSDLGLSLGGTPKPDQTDPKIVAAIDKILESSKQHGVVPGIHCGSSSYAKQMVDKGFQFVTILSDARLLAASAKEAVAACRGTA
jgi:4-hydroxy-2-oxoheptanedioate aldolase